jgi:hypothetical protein
VNAVEVSDPGRFNRREIVRVLAIVVEHRRQLLEAWNEFFAN